MNSPVISCASISKNYRSSSKEPGIKGALKAFISPQRVTVSAIKDFSLVVQPGEIVGLLGPNGAGKTTLMKMLTGIIEPSSGEVHVLGHEPFKRTRDFRRRIALVMGQKTQLWWDLPAYDSFQLLRRYYEISEKDFRERVDSLGALLDTSRLLHVHLRRLSLGERMKMELMACLLHDPDVLFLDEPTIGLDVAAQGHIRNFFRDYQRTHRTTIILTSHYMADIEALCPRIVLVLGGHKRFDGGIREFERILGREKFVSMVFSQPVDMTDPFWEPMRPRWDAAGMSVELQIPEETLRETSIEILSRYPVADYSTEKLPIERVMSSLLLNPHLLPG